MKSVLFCLLRYATGLFTAGVLFSIGTGYGQAEQAPVATSALTLQQCVEYALKNQPQVQQSMLDEQISRKDVSISLSGWFPQVNLNASLQHYFELPASFYTNLNDPTGPKVKASTGLENTSAAQFSADQVLYSTGLVVAGHAVHDLRLRAAQNTESAEITAVVDVSKSFYDVMLTIEQQELWTEEIQRLERSYEDALHRYESGLSDKIDYQQAQISVNNARAQKHSTEEVVKAKYAALKRSMGYPPQAPLAITFDSAAYEREILADTLALLDYQKRIEYQLQETALRLQNAEVGYYRWSFLPELSAFYDYNLNYENDRFSELYHASFPNSLVGLKLTLPIFQGMNRLLNLQKAHLQYRRMELGQDYLKSQISTEYSEAMAGYKSNLYAFQVTKNNITIAQEVYNTISLQYAQGIKTYLDVIVAETDLRSAKLNYLTALFQVLASKLDLNAAMGNISIQ